MTRRQFLRKVVKAGSAIFVGTWWLVRTAPRKFVRAVRLNKYPGSVKALPKILNSSNWRG